MKYGIQIPMTDGIIEAWKWLGNLERFCGRSGGKRFQTEQATMFGKMTKYIPFALLVLVSTSLPVHAQGILNILKRRPEPAPKVPELIHQLQGSDQARSRSTAANDLRQYDAKQFPEVIRALIHSLEHDVNPSVRAEAAQALGRTHPITQAAGQALERAASKDSVWRVRMQAWSSLKGIQIQGWRNQGPSAVEDYIVNAAPAAPPQQKSKSLFEVQAPSIPLPSPPVAITTPTPNSLVITEPEPAQYTVPRPLPVGAPWSTSVPTPPRRITAPEIIDEAPPLSPPPPTAPIPLP